MSSRLFSLTGGITRRHFQTEAVRRTTLQKRSPKPQDDLRATPSGEQSDEVAIYSVIHDEDQEQDVDNSDSIPPVGGPEEDSDESDSFQGFNNMYRGFTRLPETRAYKRNLEKLYNKKVITGQVTQREFFEEQVTSISVYCEGPQSPPGRDKIIFFALLLCVLCSVLWYFGAFGAIGTFLSSLWSSIQPTVVSFCSSVYANLCSLFVGNMGPSPPALEQGIALAAPLAGSF